MNINGVSGFGASRNAFALNTIEDLIEVSQGVASEKSQSITLDGNRQTQDIHNQVKDDQDAIAEQEKESKKEKRRERRHKIFGWIFHPVKSATSKIVEHHSKKTGKTPKQHKFHPLQTLSTLLHPRKLFKKVETKGITRLAEKMGVGDNAKMFFNLDKAQKSIHRAANVANLADQSDTFITGIQVGKMENKINQLKVDEKMWQNAQTMDEHDNDADQQQLSDILKDDASNAKAINNILNAQNKAKSSIVSHIAGHA